MTILKFEDLSTSHLTDGDVELLDNTDLPVTVNRPGFSGGSNFQVGWSHDEQNDEQVFS